MVLCHLRCKYAISLEVLSEILAAIRINSQIHKVELGDTEQWRFLLPLKVSISWFQKAHPTSAAPPRWYRHLSCPGLCLSSALPAVPLSDGP